MVFCLILASSLVSAGKSIPLDFEDRDSYIVAMYKSDRVFFEFDGDVHSVILDDVKENRVELDVFLYQNTKFKNHPPRYAFLDLYRDLKIDANKDRIFDLNIDMESFDNDKAIFIFTKISEEKEGGFEKKEEEIPEVYVFYNDWRVIAGVVILIGIVILFLVGNYVRKRKEIYY